MILGTEGASAIASEEVSLQRQLLTERPLMLQTSSDTTSNRIHKLRRELWKNCISIKEPNGMVLEPALLTPVGSNVHLQPLSFSILQRSPASSTPSSRPASPISSTRRSEPSLASSITSTTVSVDVLSDIGDNDPAASRSSLLSSLRVRFRSSSSTLGVARPSVHPSEFQNIPEQPEKLFIDSIGMVIPGVSGRSRCEFLKPHFVSHWRLCEPIEYTTALADHGLTYTDYSLLLAALANLSDEKPKEMKQGPLDASRNRKNVCKQHSQSQYIVDKQQAERLSTLLEQITCLWRQRGLPVQVCVASVSLFAPNRISESHIQILHVPLVSPARLNEMKCSHNMEKHIFTDPSDVMESEEFPFARARADKKRSSVFPHSALSTGTQLHHHQQLQLRDRTRPWPLWPNAIPSRQRENMNANATRYGTDPYFRAWMRAGVNSRTKCTSYAKYMIEKENDPFINTRLEYRIPPSAESLKSALFGSVSKEKIPGVMNREHYEHNRRLECRKTIENGSRLRILRFGFRNPIYPPHTPEMAFLGLTRQKYDAIISTIDEIREHTMPHYYASSSRVFKPWNKICGRNTIDAFTKVSEYVRQLNGQSRRVVWTVENIPCVHNHGQSCDNQEWEISAWNGEDPLELLIQLERWGLVEKRLGIEDEE